MRIRRSIDGAIIEVSDAEGAQLLQVKDTTGNPAYSQPTVAQEVTPQVAAVQKEADTTLANKVGVGANALIGGVSFGLFGDNSQEARRLAGENPGAAKVGAAASAFVPFGGEAALGNLANKAFGVGKGLSKARNVASAVTQVVGSTLATNTVTAVRTGDYSALTEGVSPGVLLSTAGITALLTHRAQGQAAKAARVAEAAESVAKAEQAVAKAESKAASGVSKLDTDAYADIRASMDREVTKLDDGRKAMKDVEKQYAQAQELQANTAIDRAKYERDVAKHNAQEAQRVNAVKSGQTQATYEAEVAAHQASIEAERAKLFKQYAKEQGFPVPKTGKLGAIAPLPAEHQAGFDRFLKDRGLGHLTKEADGVMSLPDRFQAHLRALGDEVPTTEKDMRKLWDEFLDQEGYQSAGKMPKRTIEATDKADNVYEGFYPEHGLRKLEPDEAARSFKFHGEIGEAGKREMVLTAEQARTLTPGRAIAMLAKLSADEGQVLLRMMSPEARAQTLLHQAGILRHAEAKTLQTHSLRTTATSERSARLRLELEDAMTHTVKAKPTAEVRAPIKAPKPLTPEDLDPTPRPYPHPEPITDFTEHVNSLGKQYEEVTQAVNALEGLKLPKTIKGFTKMDSGSFDKMAESVRTLKAHPNPEVAAVGEQVEAKVHKALSNMGVDVDKMVESEGDVMGVLSHTRRELRDHPARMQAYKAEMAAAQKELKAAQASALENGGAARGGIRQQFGGIFGRYMGSKLLTGAAMAAGFSGNGVVAALGFAAGGAWGGAAGKGLMGKKLLSIEAMAAKAERGMKIAESIQSVLKYGVRATAAVSAHERIFATRNEDFAAFFPEGKPADDSQAIMELALRHASDMQDPKSAGHRAAGDLVISNPELAKSVAATTAAKLHVMAKVLPAVPPNGYSSKGGRYPLLHPETIDRVKRACSALLHPTECLGRMIENGRFPQQELDIIRETTPDLYMEAVMGMANELYATDEDGKTVISKMHPDVQLEFARGLGIDSIPGSAPGYIAAMQQMHAVSHQPKPNDTPKPLSSGNGIRAPGPEQSSTATESQRSTY